MAGADSVTTFTNDPVTVNVLSVDSTTSPATLVAGSVAVVTQASHGTATAQSDGTILYTPATHFTGTDTFTYTVSDSNSEISSPGTVTVTVSAPTAPHCSCFHQRNHHGGSASVN